MDQEDRQVILDSLSKCKGMMDPQVKQSWVRALREQGDAQAIGVLERSDGSRCALGVLLHIYPNKSSLELNWDTIFNNATGEYEEVLFVNDSETDLPDSVRAWSGLLKRTLSEIVEWNDALYVSLPELADLIEEAL